MRVRAVVEAYYGYDFGLSERHANPFLRGRVRRGPRSVGRGNTGWEVGHRFLSSRRRALPDLATAFARQPAFTDAVDNHGPERTSPSHTGPPEEPPRP